MSATPALFSQSRRIRPAGDTGGDNAKEEFPDIAGPWLDARFQDRCAFGFGVHVVRGTLDENAPSFSCGTVDIVDLEGHLVLGALDTGAEILVGRAVLHGAEHDASLVQLVVDRNHRQAEPAGVWEPAEDGFISLRPSTAQAARWSGGRRATITGRRLSHRRSRWPPATSISPRARSSIPTAVIILPPSSRRSGTAGNPQVSRPYGHMLRQQPEIPPIQLSGKHGRPTHRPGSHATGWLFVCDADGQPLTGSSSGSGGSTCPPSS